MNWYFHRIITSEPYKGQSLHEIMWSWTIDMCLDAHMVIDLHTKVNAQD